MTSIERELKRDIDGLYRGHLAAEKKVRELTMALEECLEYFEGHSDVVDGDYGIPNPNREMNLASMIKEVLGEALVMTKRTRWIVYNTFVWLGVNVGSLWSSDIDPNWIMAGVSYPNESWLMIPPDGWECPS